MTAANGIHQESQLGKRKRSSSPQVDVPVEGWLEDALTKIQEHESGEQLLDYELAATRVKEAPISKRRRTQSANHTSETIRSRLTNKTYESPQQLMNDFDEVEKSLASQAESRDDETALNRGAIEEIRRLIQHKSQPDQHKRPALQVLSLRGQTDGGVRQLFTGLPILEESEDADTKRLPNGFEFIDSALMNASSTKDTRTFGEVFTSQRHRNLKPLDLPRQYRNNSNQLDFVPALSVLGSSNKQDYRAMPLSAGNWISYATNNPQSSSGDSQANALFKAAFSSFAPYADHSTSVITESDRSRKWFMQHGLRVPYQEEASHVESEQSAEDETVQLDDTNLEEIVQNYISETDIDGRDESEKVLEEVNELIQGLCSYQAIRDLESIRAPGSSQTPSSTEFDMYELLKTQLQLLINLLPPYAITKLNGSKLEALNIKPNIALTPPEITGTAQPDNFTLMKQRTNQNATNNTAVRTNYAASTPSYGVTPTYGGRPTGNMYNTPRTGQPPQFPQQPYRAPNATFSTPQPYQQTIGNKYAQPYVPRATQPGYQQRAQDRSSTWQRPESPQKSMPNGTPNLNSPVQSNTLMQQRLLEQMKQPQQRVTNGV